MATMVDFGRAATKWLVERPRSMGRRATTTAATATGEETVMFGGAGPYDTAGDLVNYVSTFSLAGMPGGGSAAQAQNATLNAQQQMQMAYSNIYNSSPVYTISNGGTGFISSTSPFSFTFTNGMEAALGLMEDVPRAGSVALVDEPSREMLKRVEVVAAELDLTDPRKKLAAEAEALLGYTPLRKELRTPGTLRRVLAKLEIAVLDEESVNEYKGQMAAHYSTHRKMKSPTWRLTRLRDYQAPVPEFVLAKAVEIKRELPEAEFYIDQLAVDPFLIVSLLPLVDYVTNHRRELDQETAAYVEVWAEPKFEASL